MIKLQLNDRVHKVASEIKNISDLLAQINKIFGDSLPEFFILQYKDSQKDNILIQDNNDFQLALREVTGKTLKIEIVESQDQKAHNSLQSSAI